MSQTSKILTHLREHQDGITSYDAFRRYRITRLSARIKDLRDAGHVIDTQMETKKNEDGEIMNYARYFLIKEKE